MKRRMRAQQKPKVKTKLTFTKYAAAGVALAFIGGIITFVYLNTSNSRVAIASDTDTAWYMDFGSGTGSFTSGTSTSFIPTPSSGTAKVNIPSEKKDMGFFTLKNDGANTIGMETKLVGNSSYGSDPTKFSVYDYTAGKSVYMKYNLQFSTAKDGEWYFFLGDGSGFSDANAYSDNQVFTGLQFIYNKGTVDVKYMGGKSWTAFTGTGVSLTASTKYSIEIYGNNTTQTITYKHGSASATCASQTVAANKIDIYLNGVLVGNDVAKGSLANDSNMDSWMFYGINSKNKDAEISLDDIIYGNSIPATTVSPGYQPTSLNFTSLSTTSLTVNYSAASGSPTGYLVLRKSGSEPTGSPVDFTSYTAGNTIGDATVAYVGSNTTFNETGLTSGTQYFYKVFSYFSSGECINYRQTSPLSGSQYTHYTESVAAYRTKSSGVWTSSSIWEYEYLPGTYKAATTYPTVNSKSVTIAKSTTITSTTLTLNSLTIEADGVLTVTGDLTVNKASATNLVNEGTMTVSGNFKMYGIMNNKGGSQVKLTGSSPQSIPTGNYETLIINNNSTNTIDGDITINKSLSLLKGIINAQTYTLTLASTATISGETSTNYVKGNLKTIRSVNKSKETFGGLGLTIDATANNQNLGNVTVIRTTGKPIYVGNSQSISRSWSIEPESQPTSDVSLTLTWLSVDEQIPFDLTRMQVWKSTDKRVTWKAVGALQSATARTITVQTGSFSDWVPSDGTNLLPVKFKSFTGKENVSGSLNLQWVTSEELNNEGFEIQKSIDGKTFDKIGFAKGSGNATTNKSYEFTDEMFSTNSYYRLKQIDFNGVFDFSSVIYVEKKGKVAKSFSIYPNPVIDHASIVSSDGEISNKEIDVVVFSAKGKEMMRKKGHLDEINDDFSNEVQTWEEGFYIIDIKYEGKFERLKILKSK